MAKTINPQQVLDQVKKLNLEGLLFIAKATAELIQKEQEEAEQKLALIQKGGK